ncbi:hypothetical protein PHLCEN_2v7605 [Hermanssonia centrifuga]|uniref:RING-type domain-containing protein n=1 Tax=Hermanssonia centrifuga TaxID=98765 RepID=A0A2R6NW34_9APHY|nr:hypothetical protein PHLCEN_2v7605 [Hermanssonia centrifuga]
MAQAQDVVLNMGDLNLNETGPSSPSASKKKQDTLFGPNIGIVARGPEWTETREKAIDELTPEIVRAWIAKSKEPNQSTTTLQALVNLKRPSLRLSPLEIAPSDDPDHVDSQHHHGLEFEYDCDAPKCGITVHVVLSPSHHLADKSSGGGQTKVLVFDTMTDGGFGKMLKIEEGATLELGRFEHQPHFPALPLETKAESSAAASGTPSGTELPTLLSGEENAEVSRKSKRFTSFHFRKRTHERSVAGPALPVLDAEVKEEKEDDKDDESNVGVKAVIRLSALDKTGKPLSCINEQTTYLHIIRFGAAPPPEEEDKRPWVVRVVKREATIGAHTFHLHEIYGLSSSTSNANTASSPPPLHTTYPPTNVPAPTYEEEPSSECLLCLSAPREVVLLPCRHLVACRDCAINMIEFGAGGTIVQASESTAAGTNPPGEGEATESPEENAAGAADTTATDGGPATAGTGTSAISPIAPVMPPATTRRKRKAKGWFCPVCRQPYTSCLRITTTPPSKDMVEDEHAEADITDHPLASAPSSPTLASSSPAGNRGGLASLVRPGFLRTFSRQQGPDLERGQAVAAA